ncbi:60S acidic ribosomal protein P1 [Caerostris darwini]|uniref:Large ribosomal subunit protein P1 n=2 Tax=Caerostris TaxID=172845 RepID=A0AAV4W313_9ARAC|nr:60S acidic ribosomal protein P1 [Caerostris extrusa]GIY76279.1 60S acidic ribosomal protein P1 [Caerostris darwini]
MLSNDEIACVYSALILTDDDIAITSEKIATILKAAKIDVEPYWPGLFSRCLESVDLKNLITNVGSVAPAAAAPAAAAASEGESKKADKKEEKKEESEEEDDDMGFGLFD